MINKKQKHSQYRQQKRLNSVWNLVASIDFLNHELVTLAIGKLKQAFLLWGSKHTEHIFETISSFFVLLIYLMTAY